MGCAVPKRDMSTKLWQIAKNAYFMLAESFQNFRKIGIPFVENVYIAKAEYTCVYLFPQ